MLHNLVKQLPCQKAPTARLCSNMREYPNSKDEKQFQYHIITPIGSKHDYVVVVLVGVIGVATEVTIVVLVEKPSGS